MPALPEDADLAAVPSDRRLPWETPDMSIESVAEVTEGGSYMSGGPVDTFWYAGPTS